MISFMNEIQSSTGTPTTSRLVTSNKAKTSAVSRKNKQLQKGCPEVNLAISCRYVVNLLQGYIYTLPMWMQKNIGLKAPAIHIKR